MKLLSQLTLSRVLLFLLFSPFTALFAKGDEELTGVFEYGAVIFLFFLFGLLLLFILLHEMEEGKDKSLMAVFWSKFSAAMNDGKPIEKENEILLEHDYDGIKELDNNLPPWWKYLFYVTIIFSVIYMAHYHVLESGPSSDGEYLAELKAAELEKSKISTVTYNITADNAKLLTDAGSLAAGKELYTKNCVACHGQNGEGLVGPNLADNYFIHGNTMKEVYLVIQNGVTEKGMLSWKAQFNPKQIEEVSSYVLSLVGTNPPNPKAPQGNLIEAVSTN
ncbi:MAG: c-type cytochrome [Ignavibacteriales bacterium]|nr:MAG: c-type cytochrome [Ignavibacteriales bacterium]